MLIMVLFATQTHENIRPSRERVSQLFAQGDLVPVYRMLPADLETPVSVYLKLAQSGQYSFLLESVEGGEHVGRYSFLGVNPKGTVIVQDGQVRRTLHGETTTRPLASHEDPLDAVKAEFERVKPVRLPGLPRFVGGAVGFLSYDSVLPPARYRCHFRSRPSPTAGAGECPQ
jgi:anthranilate synthase component I